MIEMVVATAIFTVVAMALYQGFYVVMSIIKASEAKTTGMLLANEQVEIIRNLPYASVGLLGGVPAGNLPRFKTIVRNGMTFNLQFFIRNIDDAFDGQLGSTTNNDLAPADYKLLEIQVGCPGCENFSTTSIVTTIAPKNLESTSNNGSLFVKVLNADGQPVPQAQVKIVNTSVSPNISIDEITDNSGVFALVGAPPSNMSYQLTVTKSDYSTAKTYPVGGSGNPNPIDRHATISSAQVTQKSLVIDRLGSLAVRTVNNLCQPIANLNFSVAGSKLIGISPNVLKFSTTTYTTGSDGYKTLSNMEWDNYWFSLASSAYDLGGMMPLLPVSLLPGVNQPVTLVVAARNPNSLLVTVHDSNNLPIADASVTLSKGGFSSTLITDRGFVLQLSWAGGSGQSDFDDLNRFFDTDGNLDVASSSNLHLAGEIGSFRSDGYLISSTFDTGSSTTVFDALNFSSLTQTGPFGTTTVKFQLASSNDPATTTWDFVGPDGTSGSYYTSSGEKIADVHNGNRYIRYKVILATTKDTVTPSLSKVSITFSSECTPFGQVLFSGLSTGTYTLSVTRDGYQNWSSGSVSVVAGWKSVDVKLNAQ